MKGVIENNAAIDWHVCSDRCIYLILYSLGNMFVCDCMLCTLAIYGLGLGRTSYLYLI